MDKREKLYKVLEGARTTDKTLVFTQTKRAADEVTRSLQRDGWKARAIHGDKSQEERDWVLKDFRSGKCPVMVATDVASRGLDVSDITQVVNFDFPQAIEDYIHRIGRTGRAGKKGIAYSFFTSKDARKAQALCKILREAQQEVPPELERMVGFGGGGRGGGGRRGGYGGGGGGYRGGGGGRRY